MITPAKGDYPSIPLNAEGKRVADAWDPSKDEAAGDQCKSYGAGNIVRQPGRIHITWEDDNTLKAEFDSGTQTRLFHFGDFKPQAGAAPNWQGDSSAQWEFAGGRRGGGGKGGDLKVVSTHMRPGYLQKNGVPYSANAIITEYFHRQLAADRHHHDRGSAVSHRTIRPQYALQETAGCAGMESSALHSPVIPGRIRKNTDRFLTEEALHHQPVNPSTGGKQTCIPPVLFALPTT